ncbi:hypothetical protein RHS01_07285 [Rhizoctonia solani]|uniref:Uncharacterized protein n=1 Tax=Rhizoctonia solani TaxID=456999 RepID=A0A8H7I7B4_9AGAM|nr:hypothetical protein RHS01_07285 [Rhizoctonia solani]
MEHDSDLDCPLCRRAHSLVHHRAIQAAHPEKRMLNGLTRYAQATVGLGFIGISSDAVRLLRTILVNTTLPENGASKDRRTTRRCYRYFCYIFELAFLASSVPGLVASNAYNSARFDQPKADRNLRLLNASAGVVLAFQLVTILVSLLAAWKVKEIDRMRCFELAALTALIIPVPIYRLCVLGIRTINVFEALSPSARAVFYIVHLAPEWLCVSVLLSTNVRSRFRTGKWGDYELRESLRDKRLAKAAEEESVSNTAKAV